MDDRKEQTEISATPMTQTTGLCIYLLGPMRIERDAVRIHLPRRKVESLLAYLFLHPEPQGRDHLATLFWGDSSDAQARHSLRTALATVRQQISPDLLHTDRDHVQLNPAFPLWIDLHQLLGLEDELDAASGEYLQTNVALWQGELLAGFYDEWITVEREYYRTRLLKLCLQVTQVLRARSEYGEAIEVAQRIVALDPANEYAHQHLMFCYVASGDRPAALRQYELCVRALQADLDAPPTPETTALYHWIRQNDGEELSPAAKITNLPIPLTSFVGRTRETAEVKRLLTLAHSATKAESSKIPGLYPPGDVRLLTLTGAGGSGKTRLAIQVATDLIDRFAQGVWWVELAALSDEGLVIRAIAKTLGVSEVIDQPLSQTVANFLDDKALLLVIDNCEHLIEPCAQVVTELLGRCPKLQILATSREPLNIAGETIWQVPTLALPDPEQMAMTDLLLQHECIRLFFERAVAVQPGFRLTLENARAVAEICARLDGIPLAIELAAARVKVLPVEQIAAYLTHAIGARFDLLTQGSRTVLPRQQTLRAAIDWSYHLLDETEQLLFRQMAVFRGGFTLEALAWIVDSGPNRPRDQVSQVAISHSLLDLLTKLVDKSLVIVEPQGEANRYRLLETLREYALEQFTNPAALETLRRRHAEYFFTLAQRAEPALTSAEQQHWLARLEAEHANLREALGYATAGADRELALNLTASLAQFWDIRVYLSEGREWLSKALAQRGSASAETQARALSGAGFLAYRQDDYAVAQQFLDESFLLFAHAEDEAGIADVLHNLAVVDLRQGHYRTAEKRLNESLALFRALNHNDGMARALNSLGNWAWDQGKNCVARDYYRESLQIRQRMGDQVGIATAFFNLGNTARRERDFVAARTYYEDCLTLSRTLDHRTLFAIALKSLGLVAFHQQDYAQARRAAEEALHLLLEIGDRSNAAFTLSNLGDVAHKLGDTGEAFAYYRRSLQLMHELGHIRGTFMGLEAIASILVGLDKHPTSAVRLLSTAARLRHKASLAVPSSEQPEYDRLLTRLQQQLDDNTFRTLWEAGQTTPLAQIVDEALAISLP